MATTESTTDNGGSVFGPDVLVRVAPQAGDRGRRRDWEEEDVVITHDLLEGLANQRQARLATLVRERHTAPTRPATATTRRTRGKRPFWAPAAWVNRA